MGRSGNPVGGRKPMSRSWLHVAVPSFVVALAAAVLPAVHANAPEEDAAAKALKAEPVPVDEFNDAVKDKVNGDGKPVRGGTLYVRMPTDPEGLNSYTNNDAPSRTVNNFLKEGFIGLD